MSGRGKAGLPPSEVKLPKRQTSFSLVDKMANFLTRRSSSFGQDSSLDYTAEISGGQMHVIYDGKSKFDTITMSENAYVMLNCQVQYISMDECTGTVKWIGRLHGEDVEERHLYIGVKLDDPHNSGFRREYLTYGNFKGEPLVHTDRCDVVFDVIGHWIPMEKRSGYLQGVKGGSSGTETVGSSSLELHHKTRQTPGSRFDRIDVPVNGFEKYTKVKLKNGSAGVIKWIGCYHRKKVSPEDYIVGVQLELPSRERPDDLTRGKWEGESLIASTKNNIRFVKLKELVRPSNSPVTDLNKQSGRQATGASKSYSYKHTEKPITDDVGCYKDHFRSLPKGELTVPGHARRIGLDDARGPGAKSKPLNPQINPTLVSPKLASPTLKRRSDGFIEVVSGEQAIDNNVMIRLDHFDKFIVDKIITDRHPVKFLSPDNQSAMDTNGQEVFPQPNKDDLSYNHRGGVYARNDQAGQHQPSRHPAHDIDDRASYEAVCYHDQFDAGFIIRANVHTLPDNTFVTDIIGFDRNEKDAADDFGPPLDDEVTGYVLPSTDSSQYIGTWKGVQGDQNSCYMDASMFAMFSYLTVFDKLLLETEKKPDDTEIHIDPSVAAGRKKFRDIILHQIVNPLRKYVATVGLYITVHYVPIICVVLVV